MSMSFVSYARRNINRPIRPNPFIATLAAIIKGVKDLFLVDFGFSGGSIAEKLRILNLFS